MKATKYITSPNNLSFEDLVNVVGMMAMMFNTVEAGRNKVVATGNDPDAGYFVRVDFTKLDANGVEVTE